MYFWGKATNRCRKFKFRHFESALYMKSVSMPLIIKMCTLYTPSPEFVYPSHLKFDLYITPSPGFKPRNLAYQLPQILIISLQFNLTLEMGF